MSDKSDKSASGQDGHEDEDTSVSGTDDEEEGNGIDEVVDDDSDLDLLIALAELDAEAAEAYRIAADSAEDAMLRAKLEEFRGDHIRHVETLNGLLSDVGGPEVTLELDEGSSSLTMLAASMGTLGTRAALLAMIANEQLTNATYQAVAELPFEDDVAKILENHLADEQRHLRWLTEQELRVRETGVDVGEET
jgi:rubrerythrin